MTDEHVKAVADQLKLCGGGDAHCLYRHVSGYEQGNTCSHRWQAYEHALSDADAYNIPAYSDVFRYQGWVQVLGNDMPEQRGTKGSWDLDESSTRWTTTWGTRYNKESKSFEVRSFDEIVQSRAAGGTTAIAGTENERKAARNTIKEQHANKKRKTVHTRNFSFREEGPNFRAYASIPYWHNAHHIIPNAALREAMVIAAGDDDDLLALFTQSLIDAKYNINDQKNMVILPQRERVSRALNLPRHIAGNDYEDVDALLGVSRSIASHDAYSAELRSQIAEVLADIADQKDTTTHQGGLPAASKRRLERISETMYERIKAEGRALPGISLDAMVNMKGDLGGTWQSEFSPF